MVYLVFKARATIYMPGEVYQNKYKNVLQVFDGILLAPRGHMITVRGRGGGTGTRIHPQKTFITNTCLMLKRFLEFVGTVSYETFP